MKLPGPDHPITIERNPNRVRVTFNGQTIVDTTNALSLREASYPPVLYVPRADARMQLTAKTSHQTHCPYKGDASYYSITVDGKTAENAIWSYEQPFPAMHAIEGYLAFYRNRVDTISEDKA